MILFSVNSSVYGQEIIVNGDFEDYRECPKVYVVNGASSTLKNWYSSDEGTPDYYNKCGSGDVKVPQTWAGRQYPKDGNGFAGVYVWPTYREYLQTDFSQHLEVNKEYKIKISYSLAGNSPLACNWLGIRFYDEKDSIVQTLQEFMVAETDPENGWVTAVFSYLAKGGEQSLAIGNFYANNELTIISVPRTYIHPMLEGRSYYFIDAVSLTTTNEELFKDVKKGDPVTLNEVYFEFDKSILKSTSYPQLDLLARYIIENTNEDILITGHTDNIGNNEYNQGLSEARAIAVLEYLVTKGINRHRLRAMGKGASEPVATNENDVGRQLNRRVTFTLIEN